MSTSVSLNSTTYTIPRTGDDSWSATGGVDDYLVALATGVLTKAGGTFTLTAEVNTGATFGLKSAYFKTYGINPSTTGVVRLANAEAVSWRNAANSADLALAVTAGNVLQFGGTSIPLSGAIVNADISPSAAIAYSKLALTGAILNADLAGSIAYSKLVLTGSIVNADVSAAAAIAYSKLALTGAILNADLAGSIAYSKLVLTGAILNGDLAGSIAYSKLVLTGAIVNADVSAAAAIAYSKLALSASIATADLAAGLLVPIAKGGTGQTTAGAAFGALSPLTTKGDLLTYDTANNRLGVGANGTVLTASSGAATGLSWTAPLTNPMTTLGDLISGGAAGAANRLAGDTSNTKKFLTSTSAAGVAAAPTWLTIASADLPTATATAVGAVTSYTPVAASGTVLISNANGTGTTADGYTLYEFSTGVTNRTFTLPAASANIGRTILVKKVDSGAGTVTVTRAGADTIDGATTYVLNLLNDALYMVADGGTWNIISGAGAARLAAYEEYNWSTTMQGVGGGTVSSSVTIRLVRVGNTVVAHAPACNDALPATNSNHLVANSAMPARFRPLIAVNATPLVYNNAALAQYPGFLQVTTGGSFDLYRDGILTTFTNGVGAGWLAFSTCWAIV